MGDKRRGLKIYEVFHLGFPPSFYFTVRLMNSPPWQIGLFTVASLICLLYYCSFESPVTGLYGYMRMSVLDCL